MRHHSLTRNLLLTVPILLLVSIPGAVTINAQNIDLPRTLAQGEVAAEDTFGLVDVIVVDVQGSVIRTGAGMLIDTSRALLLSIAGRRFDLTSIKAGVRIRASVSVSKEPSDPLVANWIEVRLDDEVVLVGKLQAVDNENGFIVVWNRRILINGESLIIFSSKRNKLKAGRTVTVVARMDGPNLIATRIHLDDTAALIGASLL